MGIDDTPQVPHRLMGWLRAGRGRIWHLVGRAPVWQKLAGIIVVPMVFLSFAAWVVVAVTSPDGWSLDADQIVRGTAALVTIGSAGAALAALLAFALTRPLHDLINAMQRVELGERDVRVEPWATDEIGEVQSAFNTFAANLQASHDELHRRHEDLAFLNELAAIVALGRNVQHTMDEVLPVVLAGIGADHTTVYLPSGEGRVIIRTLAADDGVSAPAATEVSTLSGTLMDQVLLTSTSLVLRDVDGSNLPAACRVRGVFDSWACVPLRVQQVTVGALGVGRFAAPPLDSHELGLLDSIGQVVGIGVLNAQLTTEREESEARLKQALRKVVKVQEDERRRISRELHDEAGQALTSMLLHLKSLQDQEDIETIHDRINGLRYTASSTLEELRRLSMDLRPTILDDLGLVPALRWLVSRNMETSNIGIELDVEDVCDVLPREMHIELFRIVQEGLTNVVRHSHGSTAGVTLRRQDGHLHLTITDNGEGFDPQVEPGLGLVGMRERAELLGGRFYVGRQDSGGTRLRVDIPLEACRG